MLDTRKNLFIQSNMFLFILRLIMNWPIASYHNLLISIPDDIVYFILV